MNSITSVNTAPQLSSGSWNEQLWAEVNRKTGTIIGLTSRNIDSHSTESWPLDVESQLFLDALKEYCPNHIPRMADIEWFCERYQWRLCHGWGPLPKYQTQPATEMTR